LDLLPMTALGRELPWPKNENTPPLATKQGL
jgi:hypothetical protein